MDSVLFITACPRPGSRTLELANAALTHLEGQVEHLDLYAQQIPLLDGPTLQLRQSLCDRQDYSHPMFRFARQFAQADTLVIAAPYWDLLFPAILRSYLEAVTVSGLTFFYTPQGRPQTLCRAKKLVYVTTAGGPIAPDNLGFAYVRSVAQAFFGIRDVRCVSAQGLDIVGADPVAILENTKAQLPQLLA